MIVPMMKLSLLIFYKEYQTFLGELREKGMVHIHENTERTGRRYGATGEIDVDQADRGNDHAHAESE